MDELFHLKFPFTKIDEERRVVIGVATADNVDKADDIVDFDASLVAFKNWVGNIREMHAPKAVGKALSYRPIDVVGEDGSIVRGVEVEAYVSKGAEDTWQKVIDKTLKGFSIGGNIEDQRSEFHTKLNRMIRRITKYSLGELSLVDNPCNPISLISVVKYQDGTLTYELDSVDVEKAETYTPPDGVRAEARKALDWIEEGEAGGGFTDVGRRRASQLANGQAVSIDTIKRMASYLARHQVDKNGKGWSPGEEGYPSPGRVAWAAWGGDPAVSWTNKILRSVEAMNKIDDFEDDEIYLILKSEEYDVYFCKDCGIATYNDEVCNSCQKVMINIGTTSTFDQNNISKIVDNFLKGGADMEDLQKNENNDNIASMAESESTISLNLVKEIASAMMPQFNFFNSPRNDDVDTSVVKSEEVVEVTEEEVIEKSEDTNEIVEGGEEVNTEELLKSLSAMMDEKLNEFKTEITATVDEKIETVAKSVEVEEPEAEVEADSLEKSDEVIDDKEALIKSLSERLERLEGKGAVKKSLDVDDTDGEEVIAKSATSLWDGMFIPVEVANALGYES